MIFDGREASFVHAISSAGVAHAVTRSCSSGRNDDKTLISLIINQYSSWLINILIINILNWSINTTRHHPDADFGICSGELENCGCDRSLRGMSPEGFQVNSCSMIRFYLYFGCLLVKTNLSIPTVVITFHEFKRDDYHDKNQQWSISLLENILSWVIAAMTAMISVWFSPNSHSSCLFSLPGAPTGSSTYPLSPPPISSSFTFSQWSGCSDNVDFGVTFSRTFVDAQDRRKSRKRPKNPISLMNLHNNEAGRRVGFDNGDDNIIIYCR